ncbi:hypothetical protein [Nocardioides aequoreus]|uniref:hypothetical protein n=1 Tax=Nocardioides aequoreus TaxID=397278 RepID=UPI0004C382BD|nr:hypothetical protein [Nocardioides aequoreus]
MSGAPRSPELRTGWGRTLVFVYGVFAVAATARSSYQLLTKASEAPLAYGLSALAAVVYVVATYALATGRRRLAWTAVGVELVGVLVVGAVTLLDRADFPDATVWSGFGAGYGYVPLLLPLAGTWWLWHSSRSPRSGASATSVSSRE